MARGEARPFPPKRLSEATRVAQAVRDLNAGRPMNRILLARALKVSPGSSNFRELLSASLRYRLTDGSYKSEEISLTALGEALTAPRDAKEKEDSVRAAMRHVPLFDEMLTHFQNNKLPSPEFLKNTLERQPFNVEAEWSSRSAEAFMEDAETAGFIETVGDSKYVVLTGNGGGSPDAAVVSKESPAQRTGNGIEMPQPIPSVERPTGAGTEPIRGRGEPGAAATGRRVFISHGKNREIVEQLKEIVKFGKFDPVVSVDEETTSKPVPDKVMEDMRSCFAGVIHVAADEIVAGKDGKPQRRINENVLIEIGAAMALYDGNFILLVGDAVELPSNLQGLYQCRYGGEKLDGEATMKVLKAFNDFE